MPALPTILPFNFAYMGTFFSFYLPLLLLLIRLVISSYCIYRASLLLDIQKYTHTGILMMKLFKGHLKQTIGIIIFAYLLVRFLIFSFLAILRRKSKDLGHELAKIFEPNCQLSENGFLTHFTKRIH